MATNKKDEKPDYGKQAIDPKTGKPKKDGRPRLDIDFAELGTLCELQCTLKDIAHFFHCSEDTIQNRVKEKWGITFSAYSDQKTGDGKISLRRAQFASAMRGNVSMQIWLGKQLLGQKEKQELTGAGGEPLIPAPQGPADYDKLSNDELHVMLGLLKKAKGGA